MKLIKSPSNPILLPDKTHEWENLCVCNPGAWIEDGVFYLLYRAAGDDAAHRIFFGLAKSDDGVHFTRCSDQPVMAPLEGNFDGGCLEDPRVVKMDGLYYITYACRAYAPGRYWETHQKNPMYTGPGSEPLLGGEDNLSVTALAVTKDFRTFKRLGRITRADIDDRDVILFPEKVGGRYVRLSRPLSWCGEGYKNPYPGIWISFSDHLLQWDECSLLAMGEQPWEKKIGGSTPPIRTPDGWFMLYHGVGDDKHYRVGAMLLDLENPSHVLARTREPIMEPDQPYELEGLYNGCVFPVGNVVDNGKLYVYYGGADLCCCVATADFGTLLDELKKQHRR